MVAIFALNSWKERSPLPLIDTMTSPGWIPAFSAAVSGNTCLTKAPLVRSEGVEVAAEAIHPSFNGAELVSTSSDADITGVEIKVVEARSPAHIAGLRKGDVIVAVNKLRIKNVKDLREVMKENEGFTALTVVRNNTRMFLFLR